MGADPVGFVERMNRYFALGWTLSSGSKRVIAELNGRIIGSDQAHVIREDLEGLQERRVFLVVFDAPVSASQVASVTIRLDDGETALSLSEHAKLDGLEACNVFVLGSPRSGTSEMASSLASLLKLAWIGECNVLPAFNIALSYFQTDFDSSTPARHKALILEASATGLRATVNKTYYLLHESARFLDKTPGRQMIQATPLIRKLFPDAKIVYMKRNGIANVASRMKKFGGDFSEHCEDWVATINSWEEIKRFAHPYIEISQEEMMAHPDKVARLVVQYLGVPQQEEELAASLAVGRRESTGAGVGVSNLEDTSWTAQQRSLFTEICGQTMIIMGYWNRIAPHS